MSSIFRKGVLYHEHADYKEHTSSNKASLFVSALSTASKAGVLSASTSAYEKYNWSSKGNMLSARISNQCTLFTEQHINIWWDGKNPLSNMTQ
jgi:hypothetical protein